MVGWVREDLTHSYEPFPLLGPSSRSVLAVVDGNGRPDSRWEFRPGLNPCSLCDVPLGCKHLMMEPLLYKEVNFGNRRLFWSAR